LIPDIDNFYYFPEIEQVLGMKLCNGFAVDILSVIKGLDAAEYSINPGWG